GARASALTYFGAPDIPPLPRRATRNDWLGIILIAAVVALGVALQVSAPHHATLLPRTLGQFLSVFLHTLAWPSVNHAFCAALMQLPLAYLIAEHLRRRKPFDSLARCAICLGLFAVLHAAAVAYSRGGGLIDDRPLSRYQDPLLLGVVAQAYAAVRIAAQHGLVGRLFLVSWSAAIALGLVTLTESNLSLNLPYKRVHDAASLANVRDYVATARPAVLHRRFGLGEPPDDPTLMRRILDDPNLRSVLPPALLAEDPSAGTRPPLLVQQAPALTLVAAVGIIMVLLALAMSSRGETRGVISHTSK
ncbi:MAG: hypothetical protein ABIZ04_22640, partial [Opitutus sp.]